VGIAHQSPIIFFILTMFLKTLPKIPHQIKVGLFTIFSFFIFNNNAHADSPLTSTDIASAYDDIAIVYQAKNKKKIDQRILNFLLSDAPLDQKAAVINGLGWNIDGQNNGYLFLEGLAKSKGLKVENLSIKNLNYSDKFVLGYLLAMDDYFNVSAINSESPILLLRITPLELLNSVALELPDNFTAHFIRALVDAQVNFDNAKNWCNVYQVHQLVLNTFPPSQRNLRFSAVENVMSYINLYKDYCQEN